MGVSVTWSRSTNSGNPRSKKHIEGRLVLVTGGKVYSGYSGGPRESSNVLIETRKLPLSENTTKMNYDKGDYDLTMNYDAKCSVEV